MGLVSRGASRAGSALPQYGSPSEPSREQRVWCRLLQSGSFVSAKLLLIVAFTAIPAAIGLPFVIRDWHNEDETE